MTNPNHICDGDFGSKSVGEQIASDIQAELAEYQRLEELARGNVERHLGDVEPDADSMYDEVYTLAFDALHGAGVDDWTAGEIASDIAMKFAQP